MIVAKPGLVAPGCDRQIGRMRMIGWLILGGGLIAGCARRPMPLEAPAHAPRMLARAEWGAQPPVLPMARHRIERITIHHTAARQNPGRSLVEKLTALQQFSQQPGVLGNGNPKPAWPDVPYHFYIDCHGLMGLGRELEFAGDTNTRYDPGGHALIVVEGNFEAEELNPAQWAALRELTIWLATKYRVPPERIGGHRDFADTLCPGRALQERLPELQHAVRAAGADELK